jgi:phytoene dehydrogenase-like protein
VTQLDAVVVGSGPNGLAAAITLAEAGRTVLVVEAADTPGGGVRSEALTLPGFVHDSCSAIQPLTIASPFFAGQDLARHGLELVHPASPLAHPLPGGQAAILERDVDATGATLGADAAAWKRLLEPMVRQAQGLSEDILAPLRVPRHPFGMARFGLHAIQSIDHLVRRHFDGQAARALLGGSAAHAMLPLDRSPTAGFGLMLALLAHAVGWPAVAGGSQNLTAAMVSRLEELGGKVETGNRIRRLDDLPQVPAVLFDTSPRDLLRIAGDRFPTRYRRGLERYRYGEGVFKVDWALDGPVPWAAPGVAGAGTVHVVGTYAELSEAEDAVWRGKVPDRPFVLAAQQSMFDPTRAPAGKHTLWAYAHVPKGCTVDITDRMEAQVERFAPGFRDLVLDRHVRGPAAMEAYNPNYIGGDINGGIQDLRQLFTRPVARPVPYTTPDRRLYLCSSSKPPGGGVHGMCGQFAAKAALRRAPWRD